MYIKEKNPIRVERNIENSAGGISCNCSVAKSYLNLCDPVDCSMPGSSVIHSLPEFAQIHATELVILSSHLTLCCSPFSFCLQSFPVPGSLRISWLFASDDHSIGASYSASVLPVNIKGWLPLGLASLILLSKGLSRVFSSTTVQKHQFFGTQLSCGTTLTSVHD